MSSTKMSSKPAASPGPDQRKGPQNGEKHDMEDDDLSKLPAHLQSIIDGLLDFKHFIGLQAAMQIAEETKEDVIPLSAYKPDGVDKLERARESDFVESAQRLAAGAQTIDTQDGYEWQKLFRAVMTGRIDSTSCGSNMHKSISCADNEIWRADETSDPTAPPITVPTSGLYFGFSVQEAGQRAATGFKNDPSFDNYTRKRLAQLLTQGLHCLLYYPSPVDEAIAKTANNELQPHLVCFPWAMLEARGRNGIFEVSETDDASLASAVSQVSATASMAISMFESLAKFADEKHEGQHIPPVIAITSVGANTTVWLTYCEPVDDKLRDHNMIRIWKGNISKMWDAIQFCRIVDNLFFWAQHCLKPMVTQYLSQWRQRYCPVVPGIHSLLEKDTRTAEMVHQIQDHLSFLGLLPNEDLPALVRQAVVFQGVLKSSNNERKADLTGKEQSKLPTGISLPARPGENSLPVPLSSSTDPRQGINAKVSLKGKENLPNNSDISAGENKEDTAKSSSTNDTSTLPRKPPPKQQTPVLIQDKGTEAAGESSKVAEDKKASSTNVLTNKVALNSKSHLFTTEEWREAFSEPGQIEISSAGEKYSPIPRSPRGLLDARLNLVQKTLRSMASRVENGHVLSLERQKRRKVSLLLEENKLHNIENRSKLLPGKDSDKERNTDRLSPSPNTFVSEKFELSFKITPLSNLDMTIPRHLIIYRHGPYPTLGIGRVETKEYPRITGLQLRLRTEDLAREPTIVEPLPTPPGTRRRFKVPWRGKNIMVSLPPIPPASVSVQGNSDSTKS